MSDQSDRTPARLRRWGDLALPIVLFGGLLAAWEAWVRIANVPAIFIPAPSAIGRSLWINLTTERFYYHLGVTMWEITAGFVIGTVVGLALGIAIAQSRIIERILYPYIIALQTIPKVAIAPMIIIWFGYGLTSKVVITSLIVFFPIVVNCIAGMRSAPQQQIDMLRAFTASEWQIFRMVRLKAALPYIFAGLDIAIVLAVIGAIVGEFIGSQAGLGNLLLQRNFSMDTAGSFAILIVLSAIGISLHKLVGLARRRVIFWEDRNQVMSGPIV
jgi:NitT/TauT family transport system permease protein